MYSFLLLCKVLPQSVPLSRESVENFVISYNDNKDSVHKKRGFCSNKPFISISVSLCLVKSVKHKVVTNQHQLTLSI